MISTTFIFYSQEKCFHEEWLELKERVRLLKSTYRLHSSPIIRDVNLNLTPIKTELKISFEFLVARILKLHFLNLQNEQKG